MKTKLLVLCSVFFVLFSCSKDEQDDPNIERDLELNFANLRGRWYYSKNIKYDGTVLNYNHQCATKRDFVELTEPLRFNFYFHNSDCTNNFYLNMDYYLIGSAPGTWHSFGPENTPDTNFPTYRIVKLTNKQTHWRHFLADGEPDYETIVLTRD